LIKQLHKSVHDNFMTVVKPIVWVKKYKRN
jgi:hypothetical protein